MKKVTACPVCGSADWQRLARVSTKYVPTKMGFAYSHCQRCGGVFAEETLDSPAELQEEYVTQYDALGKQEFLRDTARRLVINGYRKEWLDCHLSRLGMPERCRTALEIGPKDGSFLSLLKQDGWDVMGIDPNQRYAFWAKHHYDLEIRDGYFTAEAFPHQQFGLVAAFHLFEHIDRPAPFLAAVRGALVEGGFLYLETPNIEWIQQRQLNPAHSILYSARALAQTLRQHGFSVVAATDTGPGGLMTFDQLVVLAQPDSHLQPVDWQLADSFESAHHCLERAHRDNFPSPPDRAQNRLFRGARQIFGEQTATMLRRWYRAGFVRKVRQQMEALASERGEHSSVESMPAPIQEAWLRGALTVDHVRVLAQESNERLQLKVLARIQAYGLSVQATEALLIQERQ